MIREDREALREELAKLAVEQDGGGPAEDDLRGNGAGAAAGAPAKTRIPEKRRQNLEQVELALEDQRADEKRFGVPMPGPLHLRPHEMLGVCAECHHLFPREPRGRWAKFCSDRCRDRNREFYGAWRSSVTRARQRYLDQVVSAGLKRGDSEADIAAKVAAELGRMRDPAKSVAKTAVRLREWEASCRRIEAFEKAAASTKGDAW